MIQFDLVLRVGRLVSLLGLAVVADGIAISISHGQAIVGRATVIDGDTIQIHGDRVRFNGIDAPESSQLCLGALGKPYRCGAVSSQALDAFLAVSRPTTCEFVEFDRYGRFVGVCSRADGADVNAWLVANGHALDWPRYSKGQYSKHQMLARAKGVGVWQGSFDLPWEWRQGSRDASTSAQLTEATPGGEDCAIKGNINSKGEKIYHRPGQRHYEQVMIREHLGQRWFCSEGEAEAAGWRPSQR